MLNQPTGPTLLGFDLIVVGTILAGIAAAAVVLAIYAAVTVRDPMAKRVKSLNARREELKAGIVTPAKKRAKPGPCEGAFNRWRFGLTAERESVGKGFCLPTPVRRS